MYKRLRAGCSRFTPGTTLETVKAFSKRYMHHQFVGCEKDSTGFQEAHSHIVEKYERQMLKKSPF